MKKYAFVLVLLFVIISCSNNASENNNSLTDTPNALVDNKLEYSSKRYDKNVVDRLFEEAISKDEKLKQLNQAIKGISKTENDSLKHFEEYNQVIHQYWTSVDSYIYQINDSLTKNNIQNMFGILKDKHEKRILKCNNLKKQIDEKSIILNDEYILLKLIISEQMINNYQNNELPDIKSLSNVLHIYDSLINETKKLNKITK